MTCRRALSQVSKVRARTLGETRALVGVFGELKCGEDEFTLGACGWDAAKCAFCLRHRVGVGMLLVAAAPATVRAAGGAGVEFLRAGEWDMQDVRRSLRRRVPHHGSATATSPLTSSADFERLKSAARSPSASAVADLIAQAARSAVSEGALV